MTTIKLKNGSGAPTAGDLVQGEPALDLTNKRLYTENASGTVIEVGTNPTSLTTGTLTATSLDVTGTVTADGLTVDGESAVITLNNTDVSLSLGQTLGRIDFDQNDPSDQGVGTVASIEVENRGSIQGLGQFNFKTGSATANLDRLSIAENGDIIFYEDTGTTAKFFWDASAESLGIGTSSPTGNLVVVNTGGGGLNIGYNGTSENYFDADTQIFRNGSFSERMRIDSAGRVGIGTSSPATGLDVNGQGSFKKNYSYSSTNYHIKLNSDYAGGVSSYIANITSSNRMDISAGGYYYGGGLYQLTDGATGMGTINIGEDGTFVYQSISGATANSTVNPAERWRIDSSGNLLVGTTDSNVYNDATGTGTVIQSNGIMQLAANNGTPLYANRQGTDGDIIDFRKDGTAVGSIGTQSGALYIDGAQSTSDAGIRFAGANWIPRNAGSDIDNGVDLGTSSLRFDDIYATNALIQTSDRNEKQDIAELSDAEQRVAKACKGLLRKFRWKDAVEEKGDDARIHFGIIAQDLQDAFEAEGLDAGAYAMFISTTWWEADDIIPAVAAKDAILDEENNVIEEAVDAQPERTITHRYDTVEEAPAGAVERTRLGVRYSELLSFIIAAI